LDILLIEPFYAGYHKQWADGYKQHSEHDVELLTMPGAHADWRMHGAAVHCAKEVSSMNVPDIIVCSNMLDVATFKGLLPEELCNIPIVVYFHENHLPYPWTKTENEMQYIRDNECAFINYTTALAADKVCFNSVYHRKSFLEHLPEFLNLFPDYNEPENAKVIEDKSTVLPMALDLKRLDAYQPEKPEPMPRALVLWNNKWEHDKNPEAFFDALITIAAHGIDFKLAVIGEETPYTPPVFAKAKEVLADKIVHWGSVANDAEYAHWLYLADILPVTSYHDFFAEPIVEAMYCNAIPMLPERLVFAEHIPESMKYTFMYNDEEFVTKLQKRIMDVKMLRVMDTKQWVEKYDWSKLAHQYDNVLTAM
jgi:glycosyltransferase involved in cell wall biosynthesis